MTTTTARAFVLENFQLRLALTQQFNPDGTDSIFWTVQQGPRVINSGGFDTPHTHDLTEVFERITGEVDMGSNVMDIELRSLTWKARPGFEHVPAADLQADDVVNLHGAVTMVRAARVLDGGVVVVEFDGHPFERRFAPTALFNVAVTA